MAFWKIAGLEVTPAIPSSIIRRRPPFFMSSRESSSTQGACPSSRILAKRSFTCRLLTKSLRGRKCIPFIQSTPRYVGHPSSGATSRIVYALLTIEGRRSNQALYLRRHYAEHPHALSRYGSPRRVAGRLTWSRAPGPGVLRLRAVLFAVGITCHRASSKPLAPTWLRERLVLVEICPRSSGDLASLRQYATYSRHDASRRVFEDACRITRVPFRPLSLFRPSTPPYKMIRAINGLTLKWLNGISSKSSSLISTSSRRPPRPPPRRACPPSPPEEAPSSASPARPRNCTLSATTSTALRLEPSWASQVRYCRRPSTSTGSPFLV